MKSYTPLKMIHAGRYRRCFDTLMPSVQQDVLHVGNSLVVSGVPQGFMPQQLTVGGQFDKTDGLIKTYPFGQQFFPVYLRPSA